ncbi:MAG: fatty acid desaturase [Cyanobacteriota bacterium]|nr:fatty acid desaturase [Cyanobacteriota bacterium]
MRSATPALGLSALILLAWLGSLLTCLGPSSQTWPWWLVVAAIGLRTLLQTGLFIIGHDAMHGLLWPDQPRRNTRLGALALLLYAGLAYGPCASKHQRHHRHPGSSRDPDFCTDGSHGWLPWYLEFMAGYLSLGQMSRLLLGWTLLALLTWGPGAAGPSHVLLFCTLPLLLSSLQLFVVGTYLPHRNQQQPDGHHPPESLDLPPWLSLLACFHFGYHREHHDHPELPWFALPAARQRPRRLTLTG